MAADDALGELAGVELGEAGGGGLAVVKAVVGEEAERGDEMVDVVWVGVWVEEGEEVDLPFAFIGAEFDAGEDGEGVGVEFCGRFLNVFDPADVVVVGDGDDVDLLLFMEEFDVCAGEVAFFFCGGGVEAAVVKTGVGWGVGVKVGAVEVGPVGQTKDLIKHVCLL